MAQIINTNVPSMNAQRNLTTSQGSLNQALQRLSSGLRVNSSKDDAAGMAVAEKMNAQSRGMVVAMRNANDGISVAQVAEAGLNTITSHLQRMRELAVQAASGQYDSSNRSALDTEFQQLAKEVERARDATKFNGKELLTASAEFVTSGVTFQVGATTSAESKVLMQLAAIDDMSGNINDVSAALAAMDDLDGLIDSINLNRASLGAVQSRFEGILSQLSAAQENTEGARSRIMDTDYAVETAKLARGQILQQAGVAMLAQANALPQNVLTLIR